MKIQLISIGITNDNDLSSYIQHITHIINETEGWAIFVLPEYCWGEISNQEIDTAIEELQKSLKNNQYLVAGSYPRKIDNQWFNTAELWNHQSKLWSIQKTHVLSDEKKKNKVEAGTNQGIIEIDGLKIAIIICADIWDNLLLNELLKVQKADLLIIPALTVVPNGFANYAKTQWHSLAIVRSREYLVPIIIADHQQGGEEYDVGGASCIVDPSKKEKEMAGFEGFLELPKEKVITTTIDFEQVKAYRDYRIDKGLYSEKVI